MRGEGMPTAARAVGGSDILTWLAASAARHDYHQAV